ncbi:hypothetical protein llap_20243 [Limosa lapponica baueri]|uniref:Uncharacterized protein n=1 Tax=Limosa lapponica baueri TaxID=1758121 RepID=A0A2I0T6N4_LIMLA|nr:hypothetical protein llap_20243 [Limosa lapponica baueri]
MIYIIQERAGTSQDLQEAHAFLEHYLEAKQDKPRGLNTTREWSVGRKAEGKEEEEKKKKEKKRRRKKNYKKKEARKRKVRRKVERRKEVHKVNSWYRNPREQDSVSTSIILNMSA